MQIWPIYLSTSYPQYVDILFVKLISTIYVWYMSQYMHLTSQIFNGKYFFAELCRMNIYIFVIPYYVFIFNYLFIFSIWFYYHILGMIYIGGKAPGVF
jgi:hypothetical protein